MSKLTARQKKFVAEYLQDLNATQAAIRAGYAAKDAHVQGPRLLANVSIRELIEKKTNKQLEKLDITAERVLDEIGKEAFADVDRKQPLKHADKLKALEMLARRFGLLVDRVEHDLSDDLKQGALDLRDVFRRASERAAQLPDAGRKRGN